LLSGKNSVFQKGRLGQPGVIFTGRKVESKRRECVERGETGTR